MYMKEQKKKIFQQALDEIEKDDNILFMEDVCTELPISKPTMYDWWPPESKEYKKIWEKINVNRIKVKKYIRLKLRVSGKAGELLALYRMICTEEERRQINQQYVDMSGKMDFSNIKIGFVETGKKLASDEDEIED